jgi:hypothetical protein
MHGMGVQKVNGEVFEGTFEDGKKCGYGKMVYGNLDVYEGGWKDNQQHGEGEMR